MEIVYGINDYQKDQGGIVLALGNFDGLHLAHRDIIQRTRQEALRKALKSVVFLLDPHPVQVLYPGRKLQLLTTLEEKLEKIEALGVDVAIVEPFTAKISTLSPFCFVEKYFKNHLNVVKVIVGYDYTFGRKGKGTVNHLLRWGEQLGFEVEIVSPIMYENDVVSSSLVRELLLNGEAERAAKILGCFYQRKGRVVYGDGRGRQVGFPTANLEIPADLLLPGRGVYLSLVLRGAERYFGLTNIGTKPTFCQDHQTTTEVYILDFTGDLYHEELTLCFLHRIREERVFDSIDAFKHQVGQDVAAARKFIRDEYGPLLEKTGSGPCCPLFTKGG